MIKLVDKMIKKMKKSRKITILSVIFLLFFMACCARYAQNIEENVKKEALHDMQLLLKQESSFIVGKIEQDYGMMHGISRLISRDHEVTPASLERYLHAFSGNETYERISLTDQNANSVSSDGSQFKPSEVHSLGQKQPRLDGLSSPSFDPTSNKTIITLSLPFTTENQTGMLLSLSRDVDILEDELLGKFYEGKGICYVIDATGSIILRSRDEETNKKFTNIYDKLAETQSNDTAALINKMKEELDDGLSGVIETTFNGKQHYIAYIDVGGVGKQWNLLFVIDKEIIDQRSWAIMQQTAMLCGIAILIIVCLMFYIIRIRDKAQRGIEKLAYIDTLTQIYNLNYFHVKAAELIKENPTVPYAIVCTDIRNFKYINKTYGYTVGDLVIQDTAKSLKNNFNDKELCARISNDQFILLYWMEDYPKLLRYYAVLEEFIHQQTLGGIKIPLAFSTGIYEINDRGENIVAMIDKALLALKSAKNNAVTQFAYYDDTILNTFINNQEIENMMHAALFENEFKAYIQPKYDLRTMKFNGAEALVRWISKKKGFMRPDEFIPLFEKNGFIVELDFYILEEVCKKVRNWIDNGLPTTTISVNQSSIHMDNPIYISHLQELMEKYKIPPHHIELELTESMFFNDHEKLVGFIKNMHEMGFLISIDDFGSGYSSLNLLKEIPVDILKIDKRFLDESADSERSRIIIAQVVEMAHKLGIQVVCEGVETEQQVEFLKSIGCDMAQGYFYAKPMPFGEFDAFRTTANQV